jgi:HSP20 family molecular chaperone IbpA
MLCYNFDSDSLLLGSILEKGNFWTTYKINETIKHDYNKENGVLSIELPGVDKKEIVLDVEVTKDCKILNLSIENEKFKKYDCSFSLPYNVDTDKITSNYLNGILNVNIPKKNNKKLILIE